MLNVIVTDPPRADLAQVGKLAEYGVATVHEAIGRIGYLGPAIRPNQQGARIAGTALTVVCWPGDNLMIHAAVEQARSGDIIVITTASPSSDGAFGELLATSLAAHGVRGLVMAAGLRDTQELREMGFPAWTAHVSAQGTVKETPGAINVPVVIGGQIIRPGDAVVADDDGVCVVPRLDVGKAVTASAARVAKENASRKRLADGELGLDMYGLRPKLAGVEHITAAEYARRAGEGQDQGLSGTDPCMASGASPHSPGHARPGSGGPRHDWGRSPRGTARSPEPPAGGPGRTRRACQRHGSVPAP